MRFAYDGLGTNIFFLKNVVFIAVICESMRFFNHIAKIITIFNFQISKNLKIPKNPKLFTICRNGQLSLFSFLGMNINFYTQIYIRDFVTYK